MATNKIVYFPNVASANTKIVGASVASSTSATIYTAPAASNIRVKCFTVSLFTLSGGASLDYVRLILKIGTGYYNFSLQNNGAAGTVEKLAISSDTLGFAPSFLQVADTITYAITSDTTSGLTFSVDISLTLEDFTV